jgi:Ni,Fe-hydrogenase III small subunit/formate hydrogenlyase subunit 6/NADH:ubiquinone oxidoreductase subunit I
MWRVILARLRQGHRTIGYPDEVPNLPDRFRGAPELDPSRCAEGCSACRDACPTGAVATEGGRDLRLDLGRCLFCTDCVAACPQGAISYGTDFRLSARRRADLVLEARATDGKVEDSRAAFAARARTLDETTRRLFGRSLKLRQVSAGGCAACEADVNVLGTVVFDLGRFGIQFVASPRHADGLLITGAVSRNMELALRKTYAAVPPPKIVIAVGACAISGGPYIGHPEVLGGADPVVPVDLYIPGCPPHPITILDGLLAMLDRLGPDRVPT